MLPFLREISGAAGAPKVTSNRLLGAFVPDAVTPVASRAIFRCRGCDRDARRRRREKTGGQLTGAASGIRNRRRRCRDNVRRINRRSANTSQLVTRICTESGA